MLKVQSSRSLLRFTQSLNCNPQSKTNSKQLGKLQILHLHVWCLTPLCLVDCSTILFGWFHSLLAAFLSMYPMALASLTSLSLQGNFNVTASCFSVGFHLIFWNPPKGLHHFSSSALGSTLSSGWSTLLRLLFLVIIPRYWHLQYTGVFHSN